jgi:crotonobetainyl-CoA:carnitine CoA-transferase CaiB-like acyl-CoA transferase
MRRWATTYYRARDGYVSLVIPGPMWSKLCEAMGQPALSTDPRFATNDDRVAHLELLVKIIEDWMAGFSGVDAVVAHCAGLIAGDAGALGGAGRQAPATG